MRFQYIRTVVTVVYTEPYVSVQVSLRVVMSARINGHAVARALLLVLGSSICVASKLHLRSDEGDCAIYPSGGNLHATCNTTFHSESCEDLAQEVREMRAALREQSAMLQQVLTMLGGPAPPPPPSLSCDQDAGWTYLYEIEDDESRSSIPSTNADIAVGFRSRDAYYLGNSVLSTLSANDYEWQFCAGNKVSAGSCSVTCIDIGAQYADSSGIASIVGGLVGGSAHMEGLDDFQKMIACATGQCRRASGSQQYFFRCTSHPAHATTMINTFYKSGYQGECGMVQRSGGLELFHFYGCGVTMFGGGASDNLLMESCCSGCDGADVFQIRYRSK